MASLVISQELPRSDVLLLKNLGRDIELRQKAPHTSEDDKVRSPQENAEKQCYTRSQEAANGSRFTNADKTKPREPRENSDYLI